MTNKELIEVDGFVYDSINYKEVIKELLKDKAELERENEQLTEIIECSGVDCAEILQQLNRQD